MYILKNYKRDIIFFFSLDLKEMFFTMAIHFYSYAFDMTFVKLKGDKNDS